MATEPVSSPSGLFSNLLFSLNLEFPAPGTHTHSLSLSPSLSTSLPYLMFLHSTFHCMYSHSSVVRICSESASPFEGQLHSSRESACPLPNLQCPQPGTQQMLKEWWLNSQGDSGRGAESPWLLWSTPAPLDPYSQWRGGGLTPQREAKRQEGEGGMRRDPLIEAATTALGLGRSTEARKLLMVSLRPRKSQVRTLAFHRRHLEKFIHATNPTLQYSPLKGPPPPPTHTSREGLECSPAGLRSSSTQQPEDLSSM